MVRFIGFIRGSVTGSRVGGDRRGVRSDRRRTSVATAALACTALLAALSAAPAGPAAAAQIQLDCDPVELQAAITQANAAGGGRIKLASSCIYSITTPATASEAFPVITGDITIVGSKRSIITRDPAAPTDFRIFTVGAGATLTLKNLVVAHGKTAGLGGAVMNSGTLEVRGVTLSDNTAGNGGAIAVLSGGTATITASALFVNATTGVGGGGVLNSGTLLIERSLVSNNTAPINGGGVNTQASGNSTIVQCKFEHNVSGSLGGALSNLGTTTVVHTAIRSNTGSAGGAIATANENVTILDSTIESNDPDNCSPLNTIPGCVD